MIIYELCKNHYPEDNVSVLLQHEKKFSSKEFEKMVMSVEYPENDDEDYIDEYTCRNIHRIAEILCDKFNFQYVVAEVRYTI